MPGKFLLLFFALTPALLRAEVRLPQFLSDHMVLQRDAPIHLWGWAEPGEPVTVRLQTESRSTTADALGRWSIFLSPQAAGGPYALTIQATNTLALNDILIGDLWLASGQSNMEMPLAGFGGGTPLKDSEHEIATASHPEIRFLLTPHRSSSFPQNDIAATWTVCTPETARNFSAVAYFFGRELHDREHVPIGLIDSTWGGTPAEAWIGMDALGRDPALNPVWTTWAHLARRQTELPATIAAEKREDAQAKVAGQPAPVHPWHPAPESFQPAGLFNGMIAPFTPLSIRGVLWYQGETNSALARAPLYHRLFSSLIVDWRQQFRQGDFPFLFAQISSFRSTPAENWGILRDAQRRTLSVANTAMAVTLDVGTPGNVHPPDKQTVGHRLALAARALSYGESVHDAGPLFTRADREGSSLRIWFHDRKIALHCTGSPCLGFEIAGADRHFVPAEAKIDGTSVVITAPTVPDPTFARYAWPNATTANLVDAEDLPASTFTSEDEPQP